MWLGANIIGDKWSDKELAQSDRCLLVHAEICESGTATAGAKGRNIFFVNGGVGAGHCGGGVVVRKIRTTVGSI